MPVPFATTTRPVSLHSAATFRFVVARQIDRRFQDECASGEQEDASESCRNASSPIFPFPMCSCRSTRVPSAIFESFTCTTSTRCSPTVLSISLSAACETLRCPNVPPRGEKVSRVDANSQIQFRAGVDESSSIPQISSRSNFRAPRCFQEEFADRQIPRLAPPAVGPTRSPKSRSPQSRPCSSPDAAPGNPHQAPSALTIS